ncbi:alpha-hydroxy-acid oxidizing protein [Roseateles sp. BYS78W]|uniref:Isopentenyl-diphosphate delta-isomerase n=1 Tax=Pelomonas candidula TaxID=3299025 RepID=A0ABW7H6I9_9BURK
MDLLDIDRPTDHLNDRPTALERAPDKRRRDPLRLALAPAHEARGLSGLDGVHLMHDALPELDLEDVSLEARLFGQAARTPFYVTGLATGRTDAATLNRRLARACARRGWAMGVGLQRRPASGPDELPGAADAWQRLRDAAPGLALIVSLGLSQVASAPLPLLRRMLQSTEAQALAVHLNPLQECLQADGMPQFRGGLAALRETCAALGVPVVLKESGCGFSPRTLARLQGLDLGALDVGGLGGTHWGRIEGARAEEGSLPALVAGTFADWGESTVGSVRAATRLLPDVELWASGGVRSGLDAAKLVALGAERVGYAKPALQAALWGDAALDDWMARQEQELRIALFCSGAATPAELRRLHAGALA